MSAKSIIVWGFTGFLVVTAASMLVAQDAPAMTLERGLGPDVQTTRL